MSSSSSPLVCQRALFSIPNDHCYLNSAFMGPLPILVERAGIDAIAARSNPMGMSARDFFEPAERVRLLCAQLVNADPERISFVPTGLLRDCNRCEESAAAKRAKRRHAGRTLSEQCLRVAQTGEPMGSNCEPCRRQMPPGSTASSGKSRAALWNEALIRAIDKQTLLVAVEPAHWTDGTLFDLERIGQRTREVGAALVVDATQVAGAMPIDAQRIQADALVVHSYKSMLSNYGLGFTVFGDRFLDASPIEESWLMRAGSDNFARLVDYEDDYAAGMRRFDSSLRANPMLIAMLEAACRLLIEWQPARVRDYLLKIERKVSGANSFAGLRCRR